MNEGPHEELVEAAKAAISEVNQDLSVDMQTTLDDLKDIRAHTDLLIEGLEETMK